MKTHFDLRRELLTQLQEENEQRWNEFRDYLIDSIDTFLEQEGKQFLEEYKEEIRTPNEIREDNGLSCFEIETMTHEEIQAYLNGK